MKMKSPSQEWRIINSYKMALEHCQKKYFLFNSQALKKF